MLKVHEAQAQVLERTRTLEARSVRTKDALGLVLAEDVASDLDMPPYDKAMMDGYAVRSADLSTGKAELTILEEVTAGKTPTKPLGPGQATRIMTGAPIPEGADAVVMIERCQTQGERVRIEDRPPKPDQHILRRGREMRTGETVLRAGAQLRPYELGLLASVGRWEVRVLPRPRVAILSTGDEVVEANVKPGPGQIRNSNGPMLVAQATRAGGVPEYLGIARDDVASLRTLIGRGLEMDVLILSGGVSAGKLDLVPGVLSELGVEAIFHKVEMKPGKPVFFGVKTRTEGGPPRLVFGLPGNPVSALVCFELFVAPALRRQMGLPPGPRLVQAELTEDYAYRTDRVTYHPARLESAGPKRTVRVVPWFGSPDLRSLSEANAFVVFPAGDHVHRAGSVFEVLVADPIP